ncbi:hypothetical protein K492DRAFT_237735 [Lichtheimia hyalospora FSU 10163]|nr:hypothetical protein K492DRAFT_237735 [Lichtheimia hyalospora FSU 10163]
MSISASSNNSNSHSRVAVVASSHRQYILQQQRQRGLQPQRRKTIVKVILDETFRRSSVPIVSKLRRIRDKQTVAAASPAHRHGQAALLALAIRQHPLKCIPRSDLIKAALDLDTKISQEQNTPRLFQGKTPVNSASAILSHNVDRYFEAIRPQDSPCLYYRLAIDPALFENAFKEYKAWEMQLIKRDWPSYFGVRVIANGEYDNEFDRFMLARRQELHVNLDNVPTTWSDLLCVVDNGSRLVAKRNIPVNIPLGFYFGVPMSKHEFAVLKEGVGNADQYCVLYGQKTILDATNDDGQPYQENGVSLCPFHIMRETKDVQCVNVCLLEGVIKNQVICWTRRGIQQGEELMLLDRK